MADGRFATAINCIDGRAQLPVSEWMRTHFSVDFVDTITHPGPDGALTRGPESVIQAISENVGVSVTAHESRVIAVAGHHGCAGYPVSDDTHKVAIRAACHVVAQWGFPARILGLWVNDQWQIEVVWDSENQLAQAE